MPTSTKFKTLSHLDNRNLKGKKEEKSIFPSNFRTLQTNHIHHQSNKNLLVKYDFLSLKNQNRLTL